MTEKTTNSDRRSGQRLPVSVPVKLRHEGSEHQGLTRDLSSTGIFLYTESGMKAGSKLDKAKALGISIIDEAELRRLLDG